MKYSEHRLKMWRERMKFGITEYAHVDEMVEEMRTAFGHLCNNCRGGKYCSHKKGGRSVLLACPFYLKKEMEARHRGKRFEAVAQSGSSGKSYQYYAETRQPHHSRH